MGKIPFYKKDKFNRGTAHIVYDLTIDDINERKEKAIKFTSANQCAHYLGITPDALKSYVDIKAQKRFYSTKHNKPFAIRLAKGY